MTTPHLSLPHIEVFRGPVAPRLAYPALMLGLLAALAGYAGVALLLVRLVVGLL